jgi:formamidopyrimidine-DNA glycosylase
MPELAEVEYYRKLWDPGLGAGITAVRLHAAKRIFRGTAPETLRKRLAGSLLLSSEAHGKQMLFRFSKGIWLGLHLGMTGELRVEKNGFRAGKHDHLVLYQEPRALVFSDPRQFGRVRLHLGAEPPKWWMDLPAPLTSSRFTQAVMMTFLQRHRKLPLKAALLLQSGFPGLGNWMVDEILWRARLDPRTPAGELANSEVKSLWRIIRSVCRAAIKSVSRGYSALPPDWLFHERWDRRGKCPRDGRQLVRETVGGRTTAWCPTCQPKRERDPRSDLR